MSKIIVSACLLGCECRYDGKKKPHQQVIDLSEKHALIPICPEQMGGLPTPRIPSEVRGDKVINSEGKDVTNEYHKGATMALNIAKLNAAKIAILKAKSPSCGKGKIYDGTFSSQLIDGNGITVRLFLENGIEVYTENEINEIEKRLVNDQCH